MNLTFIILLIVFVIEIDNKNKTIAKLYNELNNKSKDNYCPKCGYKLTSKEPLKENVPQVHQRIKKYLY